MEKEESRKLSRDEIIELCEKRYKWDMVKPRVRVVSHEGNPLAPERYCYKVSFEQFGKRVKFGVWPNTVGYQGY